MCLSPIRINYSDNYKNYRGTLIHAYNTSQMLPCGKCLICKENKIEEWVNRWTEQMKVTPANTSYFLTLTYSDENLTYISTPKGEFSTLNYDDVQKFLKRLRKRQTKIEKINNLPPPNYRDWETDRKSTRLNSSHRSLSRMPSSA